MKLLGKSLLRINHVKFLLLVLPVDNPKLIRESFLVPLVGDL
jgi:hypothetical protein